MKKQYLVALSLAACLVQIHPGSAQAYNGIGGDWRDQYPDVCQMLMDATLNANDCILCHDPGSSDLNSYGVDLADNDRDFVAIEGDDSDGDGRTNGEEILIDCTLPGDELSVPVDGEATWSAIKTLFR